MNPPSHNELRIIAKRHIDDLDMIMRYNNLLKVISLNNPDFRLHFMRIIFVSLKNDLITRFIRVFDPSPNSFSINRTLNEFSKHKKLCENHKNAKKEFNKFSKKIKNFRNKYYFHNDKLIIDPNFNPKKELWDNKDIEYKSIIDNSLKAYNILLELYNSISDSSYPEHEYDGKDFEIMLQLVNTSNLEYFYPQKPSSKK